MNNGTQDGFGKPSAVRTIGTKLAILGRWLGIGTSDADAPLHIQVGADSAGNNPTNPQYGAILEWFEGRRNLGIGEGTKLSWRVKLIGDKKGVEVANIASHKTNSTDTSRLSSVKVNVSADGIAAPTEVVDITSSAVTVTGDVLSNGGTLGYDNTGALTEVQATNKFTDVSLDANTGLIVTDAAALASGARATFRLLNTSILSSDILLCGINFNNGEHYSVSSAITASGFAKISLKNESGGSRSEGVPISFAVIRRSV